MKMILSMTFAECGTVCFTVFSKFDIGCPKWIIYQSFTYQKLIWTIEVQTNLSIFYPDEQKVFAEFLLVMFCSSCIKLSFF